MNNEIIENNVLIEEFMEGEFNANGDQVKPKGLYAYGGCYNIENLRYHSSYDWLIPVIRRIREILNTELSISEYYDTVEISQRLNPYAYDIESIFKAVIEFIKWYNQNK